MMSTNQTGYEIDSLPQSYNLTDGDAFRRWSAAKEAITDRASQLPAQQLLPLVYDELRQLAAHSLAREKPGQTLQPTALVHEAFLRLVGDDPKQPWDSRGHFFAAAAEAMRRILVEQARRKGRIRHGAGLQRVDLPDAAMVTPPEDEQVLLLDEALTRLAAARPQAAELVQLRFFSGQTVDEAATMLGLSPRTARRLWVFARAWLRRDMERAVNATS
jgi:RNA polymerase sigma factor (TIGR02999 family)